MTPKPPPVTLRNNGNIVLDLEAVFMDPRAKAIQELRKRAEERKREEEADEPIE